MITDPRDRKDLRRLSLAKHVHGKLCDLVVVDLQTGVPIHGVSSVSLVQANYNSPAKLVIELLDFDTALIELDK